MTMKTHKEAERDREVLAAQIVQEVFDTLQGFGLIRETSPTIQGHAIADAIQHVEAKLPLSQ
jgi:hypothetical protein